MTHEIVWSLDPDGFYTGTPVCTEPPTAQCRWQATGCDCEVWYDLSVDKQGPYHRADGPPPSLVREVLEEWLEDKHRMSYGGDCNVVTWLQHEDMAEAYLGTDPVVIGRTIIKPSWEGDHYGWTASSPQKESECSPSS